MQQNLQELQQRCQEITGKTLGEVAARYNLPVPANLSYAKGWIGQLIEQLLGASGGSQAITDFPELGIELKTIPVSAQFKPLESTYVCTVQSNANHITWRDSWVYHKLRHVLWIPIISENLAIQNRIIATPIWWQMDPETEEILRTDWEELMEILQLGYGKNISAKYGQFLHIRPKAANSQTLVDYVDADGSATRIVPRGFYLRTEFTRMILGDRSIGKC